MGLEEVVAERVAEVMAPVVGPLVEAVERLERLERDRQGRATYTVNEAAEVLGASPNVVRRWVANGHLRALPDVDKVLIPRVAVERFLAGEQEVA